MIGDFCMVNKRIVGLSDFIGFMGVVIKVYVDFYKGSGFNLDVSKVYVDLENIR